MPSRAYHYTKLKRTEFVIYNEATLRYLARFKKKAKVHLFINSGMNREGIKDIAKFISDNRRYLDKVEVTGLCSHLAAADSRSILNSSQEDFFMESLALLRSAGYFPRWIHLGNSAAQFWSDNRLLTAFRPGLALYGYSPFLDYEDAAQPLEPGLEIYSKIISLQDVDANENVSYNEAFRTNKSGQIAVIPFGYYEGLDRRLSNQAEFLVDGNGLFWARIAGRVCMNLTCLDVSGYNVQIGDEVQVVSSNPDSLNSVENLASLMDTSVYEFLAKINPKIRRIIKNLPNIK
jgi:alanine racemase